jgi:hypothetical protein
MKLGVAVFLGLALGGTSLTAQQSLLASAPLPPVPLSEFVLPATPASAAPAELPETAPKLAATVGVGLPNISLYNSIEPQLPAAVCAQLRPFSFTEAEISSYAFSKAQFSLATLKASFEHDNLVKMAHNFVPGQPLPDAPSYVPLTPRQKFDLFLRSTHSVDMGFSIMADALIAQASGAWPTLGGGMGGFGQRLGVSAAGEEAASFFSGFVFPTLFHQDPRYFRSHQTRIVDRLAYAASRVIIGRSDDGRNVINYSAISGQFVQAAVSNAYVPYRNESVSGTIENALAGLSGVAQAQILNEFWPDIKQFLSSHTPGMRQKEPSASATFTFR